MRKEVIIETWQLKCLKFSLPSFIFLLQHLGTLQRDNPKYSSSKSRTSQGMCKCCPLVAFFLYHVLGRRFKNKFGSTVHLQASYPLCIASSWEKLQSRGFSKQNERSKLVLIPLNSSNFLSYLSITPTSGWSSISSAPNGQL